MKRIRCLTLVSFLVIAPTDPTRAQEPLAIDGVWLERLRTEGRAALAKYESVAERIEVVSETRYEKLSGDRSVVPFRSGLVREGIVNLGDCRMLETTRIFDDAPGQPQIRLQCDNPDYWFDLGKKNESAPWVVNDYQLGARKLPLRKTSYGIHMKAFGYLQTAMDALDNTGDYSLQGVGWRADKQLLRLQIKRTGTETAWYEVFVDPDHDWRVVECRIETPRISSGMTLVYGPEVAGLTFPRERRAYEILTFPKAPPSLNITERLISIKATDKTPADFRLGAFGLPEPVDVPQKKAANWHYWFAGIAFTIAALGCGCIYLGRRHRTRKPQPGAPTT